MSSSSSLAQLIIGDSAVEEPLEPAVAWVREKFPANEMIPMVQRRTDKPSERVRLRNALQDLRDQGLQISCPDFPDKTAPLYVSSSFDRSGSLHNLSVQVREVSEHDSVRMLQAMQERMLAEAIPLLASRDLCDGNICMEMTACTMEELPWMEAGIGEVWDIPMEQALLWAKAFDCSSYEAMEWHSAGFSLEDACAWHRGGEGFYWPEDALEWLKLVPQGMTAEIAIELDQEGVSAKQAQKVRKLWSTSAK